MPFRLRGFLLTLLSFLLPVTASAQTGDREYAIRPGDQVVIALFTQSGEPLPSVVGERFVDRNGRLYLPFVGSTSVVGLDTDELRTLLEERFSSFYDNPVVDVLVRLRVNITGAVRDPGHYFVLPGSTVVDALAVAGGTLSEVDGGWGGAASDPSRVRLIRGEQSLLLDMRADAVADPSRNLHVLSGDWIYVPRQPRARVREDVLLATNILSAIGSLAALILLFTR